MESIETEEEEDDEDDEEPPFHQIQPYQSVKLLHHMHICFGRAITSLSNGIRHTPIKKIKKKPKDNEIQEEEDLDHLEDDLEEVDQEEEEEIHYQNQDEQDDYANHQDPIALLDLTFVPILHLLLGNSSISQFTNLARVLISSHDSIQSISALAIIL
ncbi:hypothetical protein O181_012017 [Austropuccinia psidii MF-1]|uniref:Uncharacterized protein n=1 Tax=Austropuccinia psidii MF-1 TaxID=1389203 RepID=A0A9Q3GML9_9BASI|nr:hypothetical protein [Austropuccinia psidii MF-1]